MEYGIRRSCLQNSLKLDKPTYAKDSNSSLRNCLALTCLQDLPVELLEKVLVLHNDPVESRLGLSSMGRSSPLASAQGQGAQGLAAHPDDAHVKE